MGRSKPEETDSSVTVEDSSEDKSVTDTDIDVTESGELSPAPDSSPFVVNETVLAFHNLQLYEAKVQKVELQGTDWTFFIHYTGWSKTWDEWVGMDRLMKLTDENLQKKKELDEIHRADKITNVSRRNKRKRGAVTKGKSKVTLENEVSIHIPSELKKQLLDDCEYIKHIGKLVTLPRSPTVGDILDKYLDDRLKKDGSLTDSVKEILDGLRCYFDKALPGMLLYGRERQQYEEAVVDGASPSTIYGAEHLLRLLVKFPEMLYSVDIDEETLKELQQNLVDILKFMQINQSEFFLPAYEALQSPRFTT